MAIPKDPAAVLDYEFPWATWLGEDNIVSFTIRDQAGALVSDEGTFLDTTGAAGTLTLDSASITNESKSVTMWLSSGTVDKTYWATCRIVTAAGRTDDRTMRIRVKEK